jgi:hypothetical protein
MYGNCGRLYSIACQARDETRKALEQHPGVATGDAAVAIIMSVVAAEGFINELAEFGKQFAESFAEPKLTNLSGLLKEAEDNHAQLVFKYQIAALVFRGALFPKGENPLQDFAMLCQLRNALVHFRHLDDLSEEKLADARGDPTMVNPKLVRSLQQRGLARKPGESIMSWFDCLLTAEMADWACATSKNMMSAIVSMAPGLRIFFSHLGDWKST